jgi:SAM-dependent methyltransferase
MNDALAVDASALREEVKAKYRAVAVDKRRVFSEILRVLRPGGRLQFADIANGKPIPEAAIRNIDLWTD